MGRAPIDTNTGLPAGSPVHLDRAMKLTCSDENMAKLVHAMYLDHVPAVMMERAGPGWHIEFVRPPHATPYVDNLLALGIVDHR